MPYLYNKLILISLFLSEELVAFEIPSFFAGTLLLETISVPNLWKETSNHMC